MAVHQTWDRNKKWGGIEGSQLRKLMMLCVGWGHGQDEKRLLKYSRPPFLYDLISFFQKEDNDEENDEK